MEKKAKIKEVLPIRFKAGTDFIEAQPCLNDARLHIFLSLHRHRFTDPWIFILPLFRGLDNCCDKGSNTFS